MDSQKLVILNSVFDYDFNVLSFTPAQYPNVICLACTNIVRVREGIQWNPALQPRLNNDQKLSCGLQPPRYFV